MENPESDDDDLVEEISYNFTWNITEMNDDTLFF